MATDIEHHTLSVLVENKAGVLARIVNLFSRRAYNIVSLAVAPTEDERDTLVAHFNMLCGKHGLLPIHFAVAPRAPELRRPTVEQLKLF